MDQCQGFEARKGNFASGDRQRWSERALCCGRKRCLVLERGAEAEVIGRESCEGRQRTEQRKKSCGGK